MEQNQRMALLQRAIEGIPDLRQIHTQAEPQAATGGTVLTCDHHVPLLESAAQLCDRKHPTDARRCNDRTAKVHDIEQLDAIAEDADDDDCDENCDDDTPATDIIAHVSKSTKAKPHTCARRPEAGNPKCIAPSEIVGIDRDTWVALSRHAQQSWNGLQNGDKLIFLGCNLEKAPDTRTANIHDQDTIGQIDNGPIGDPTGNSGLLANSAKLAHAPPADTRNAMASASTRFAKKHTAHLALSPPAV